MSASNLDLDAGQLALNGPLATGTVNSPDLVNTDHNGVKVVVDITTIGTASVVVTIQGKDAGSGSYYTILASAALVGNGVTVLTVYPGITASSNVSVSDVLPRQWRISVAVSSGPATLSVGACLVV